MFKLSFNIALFSFVLERTELPLPDSTNIRLFNIFDQTYSTKVEGKLIDFCLHRGWKKSLQKSYL